MSGGVAAVPETELISPPAPTPALSAASNVPANLSLPVRVSHIPEPTGCGKIFLTKFASLLTDPPCLVREYAKRISIVHDLHTDSWWITNTARIVYLALRILGYAALSLLTALPGMGLRALANECDNNPYIYLRGEAEELQGLNNRKFTLAFKNYPGGAGGYSLTDAGVMPLLPDRIEAVCQEIFHVNADILCLCEIMDSDSGFELYRRLKGNYSHFYFNMGPKALTVSSGLFVASKFRIVNPEFVPFPLAALVGRTSYAAKGFFGFDTVCNGRDLARIYVTHPQHSEIPEKPEQEEKDARKLSFETITAAAKSVKKDQGYRGPIVVTGDFNLDDKEYTELKLDSEYQHGDTFPLQTSTWGGDWYCAKKVCGKPDNQISTAKRLDYTLALRGTIDHLRMTTRLIPSQFDSHRLKPEVTSDHEGLLTEFEEIDT